MITESLEGDRASLFIYPTQKSFRRILTGYVKACDQLSIPTIYKNPFPSSFSSERERENKQISTHSRALLARFLLIPQSLFFSFFSKEEELFKRDPWVDDGKNSFPHRRRVYMCVMNTPTCIYTHKDHKNPTGYSIFRDQSRRRKNLGIPLFGINC